MSRRQAWRLVRVAALSSGRFGVFGVGLLWRGVVAGLVVLGSVVVFLLVAPVALAQSDVPDAPTAVAVYSIESEKLEVRWSSSDSSVTSFKIQWKSGSEEFDSSRQVTSDPATSIESAQSTSAGDRYKETISGLTDGTEYTVRVVAANSNGDSDPSSEVTGTPQSTPAKHGSSGRTKSSRSLRAQDHGCEKHGITSQPRTLGCSLLKRQASPTSGAR